MPTYIMFIRATTLDESRIEASWSKASLTLDGRPLKALASNRRCVPLEVLEVKGVVEVARAWCENPAQQAAAQRQFDSWLADMEYCDRF